MRGRFVSGITLAMTLAAAPTASAQDLLGVGTIGALPGQVRDVAVTVRDVGGTLLDEGDGPGLEIQGFAFRVDFAPAQSVAAVTFLRSGVTAGHTPLFPVVNPQPGYIVVLMSFDETSDPLDFHLDAAPPGDTIGLLRFTLSGSAPLDSLVILAFAPASATLVNGTATLEESVANGQLALTNGAIEITAAVFSSSFESGDFAGWSIVVGG